MNKSTDIIIPVKGTLKHFVILYTVPFLLKNLKHNKIYVLSDSNTIKEIKQTFSEKLNYLNGDAILDNLTRANISDYFNNKINNSDRSGWYFQQFAKLSLSQLDFISEHYIVWDADCIALKPISFFDDKKVLFTKNNEFHSPYFKILETLLGIKRQVDYSFISEHMVFKKQYVSELLNTISKKNPKQNWWFTILDAVNIADLPLSGFSEYELYGNFIANYYPESFKARNLSITRNAKRFLGEMPNKKSLHFFSFLFSYISIEEWQSTIQPKTLRRVKSFFFLLKTFAKKPFQP